VHKLHILEVNSAQIATKYQNPFKNTQKRCQLSQIVEMGDEFVDFDDDASLNVETKVTKERLLFVEMVAQRKEVTFNPIK